MTNYRLKYFQGRRSVYHCVDCQKLTRDTGIGEASVDMCAKCYLKANADNLHSDGVYDDVKYADILARIESGDITDPSEL